MYVTQQGDTWDIIAKRLYGDELRMHELLIANAEYRTVVIFPAGVALNVPELADSVNADDTLPLWKRNRDGSQ